MKEYKKLFLILMVFLGFYYLPLNILSFRNPVFEALALTKSYAQEHVLLCLLPAFFIAGAVSIFISRDSVVKYFGSGANKFISYSIASLSGAILAVCSCTVLPLFSGIYKRGAGLGPAIAFLYSGPAINIMAIILTARVLGYEFGLARGVGAILFSILIGFIMHLIFLKEERVRKKGEAFKFDDIKRDRSILKNIVYFLSMIAILVFANWPSFIAGSGVWYKVYSIKWLLTGMFLIVLSLSLIFWFKKGELKSWVQVSWRFAKQIMPLLLIGVLISGALLGRPGKEGLIPSWVIVKMVGSNTIFANIFASIIGAFMYFATLTEVVILEGLLGAGMNKGPALALLLAGPALSLPNMLVINSVLGLKKTVFYVFLVVVMASISGLSFGYIIN